MYRTKIKEIMLYMIFIQLYIGWKIISFISMVIPIESHSMELIPERSWLVLLSCLKQSMV